MIPTHADSPHFWVGSLNPVKITAVRTATTHTWPNCPVTGVEVASGVGHQPLSDEETYQGAVNRAQAALHVGLAQQVRQLRPVGVGLEGGVFTHNNEMWSTVWGVVVDTSGQIFASNGARFKVPTEIAQPIWDGEEMGVVVARMTNIENLKQKQGMIGIVTHDFVNRTEEYIAISKLSIGLWYGQAWREYLNN